MIGNGIVCGLIILMVLIIGHHVRRNTLEAVLRRLWCRNTLLQIPVIAKSKLQAHEINGLVNEMKPVSFDKGKINLTNEMKAAM